MKTNKVFILYQYNQFANDYEYIKEYLNKKEIQKDNIIKLKNKYSINQYIKQSIEDITSLINDKYIIIQETL